MVWLYDAVFVSGSLGVALRRRPWYYAGLTASWAALAVLNVGGPRFRSAGFESGVPWWTYLLNQGPMISTYLRLTVWPDPLVADYGPTTEIPLAAALPGVLLVSALIGLVLVVWRKHPPLAYLGTWFFVTLSPSSSVIPIATEVGAERRMYLPLAALVVVGVLAVRWMFQRLGTPAWRRPVSIAVAATAALALTAVTNARHADFHDRLQFWQSVVDARPHGRAHHNLAIELAARGRGDEALTHYRIATADAPEAHYAVGFELAQRGQVDEAIAELRQFIAGKPNDNLVPRAYTLLGLMLRQRGDITGAVEAFRTTLTMRPLDAEARGGLADGLLALGQLDDAERAYRAYLEVAPANPAAHTNLGAVLSEQGRHAEAVAAFARSVELAPQSPDAHLNLGLALMAVERRDDALREFRRGLELDPGHALLRDALTTALATHH